jgi:hypothetical protein
MDGSQFDNLLRSLTGSRRSLLPGALTLVAGWQRISEVKAKKKPKNKPKLNAFGCLNVGQKCRGKDSTCCSGLCQGKKPKKGQKDKSTCVAHNDGGCTPERSVCVTGSQASLCGPEAVCLATTGNAGFCANVAGNSFSQEANCRVCSKDTDCEAAGFGQGAACVLLNQGVCATPESTCVGFNGSSGTACLPPGA